MRELHELVGNLPYEIVGSMQPKLKEINPRFFLGSGKAAEIIAEAKRLGARTIVFNDDLSPSQQGNWEEEGAADKFRVVDRQEIIL